MDINNQKELTDKLNQYRDAYYNKSDPLVSDAEYDAMFDKLKQMEQESGIVLSNSPTRTVGYEVKSKLIKVKHDIPLLSLDKTKDTSDLIKFIKANPIYGTLAEDSQMRKDAYLKTGCNAFKNGHGKSTPMGFWTRQDVLRYLHDYNIPIAPPYGNIIKLENGQFEFTGEHNTGCKLCLFGCHLEHEPNRIQRLATIEPNTYKFVMKSREEGGLGYREVMDYLGIPYETSNNEI